MSNDNLFIQYLVFPESLGVALISVFLATKLLHNGYQCFPGIVRPVLKVTFGKLYNINTCIVKGVNIA